MATAKKPSGKAGGAKKSASATKKRATEKKAPPTKTKSVAAKLVAKLVAKTTAKPAAKAPAKPVKPAPTAKSAAKEKATSAPTQIPNAKVGKSKKPGRAIVVKAGTPTASKLGTKWSCFRCGAKFYDLNKPEPLCPKCGADQRQRPKVSPPPTPAPEKRKQPRPMAPLLEDEDDGSVRYEEDIDLGVRAEADEPDEDLFQPGEFEEDEPFGGAEEE
jgi:hypothetical protein